jgi:hypothetical protein
MRFLHNDLGQLDDGQVVEVTLRSAATFGSWIAAISIATGPEDGIAKSLFGSGGGDMRKGG